MNTQISKMQMNSLEVLILDRKTKDEMSLQDWLLDLFLPVKIGVHKNGLTIHEIIETLNVDNSYETKCLIRVRVCNLVSYLIKNGIPFGGIKSGNLKRYGFTNKKEFKELTANRKMRMLSEIQAGDKYLDDDDPMKKIIGKFIHELDTQLKLFM